MRTQEAPISHCDCCCFPQHGAANGRGFHALFAARQAEALEYAGYQISRGIGERRALCLGGHSHSSVRKPLSRRGRSTKVLEHATQHFALEREGVRVASISTPFVITNIPSSPAIAKHGVFRSRLPSAEPPCRRPCVLASRAKVRSIEDLKSLACHAKPQRV